MQFSTRTKVSTGLACAALLGLALARPDLVPTTLANRQGVEEETWQSVQEQGLFLDQQLEVAKQRSAVRRQVTRRLLQKELTLFEAAALFRQLGNGLPDPPPADYLIAFPGSCDGERSCRQVIRWAYNIAWEDVGLHSADQVAQRLERELADHIAQHSKVILPDLSPEVIAE